MAGALYLLLRRKPIMANSGGKHEANDNFNPSTGTKGGKAPDPKHVPKHEKPEGGDKK
jgi:hypothetical protein